MKHLTFSLDFRRFRFNGWRNLIGHRPKDGSTTLYLLCSCFCIGIAIGALLIRADSSATSWVLPMLSGYDRLRSHGFLTVFLCSFGCAAGFLILSFLSGLFVPGVTAAPIILLGRGVLYGLMAGRLCADSVLGGLLRLSVSLLPEGMLGTMVLLLALRETIGYSASLFRATILGKEIALQSGFFLFGKRYLILLGLSLIPSILSAILAQFFG